MPTMTAGTVITLIRGPIRSIATAPFRELSRPDLRHFHDDCVIDNGTAEIEYTYDQSGVGGVVACVGESSYGPIGTNPAVATPTFSPAPGAYGLAQSVTLADTTPGAVIYYTTNGTAPTIQSAVYTGPIRSVRPRPFRQSRWPATPTIAPSRRGRTSMDRRRALTFPPIPTQTYPTGPIVLSATASSGLPIKYTVLSGPATVNGNILTITGAGSGRFRRASGECAVLLGRAGFADTHRQYGEHRADAHVE